MLSTIAFLAFAAVGTCGLAVLAVRDHRAALSARAALLADVAKAFHGCEQRIGPDGFPSLTARLRDRRELTVELLADTLVTRRLPQLWLMITLRERVERPRPSIGALARPTGAEFYAVSADLPERLEPSPGLDGAVMIRASADLEPHQRESALTVLQDILSDKRVKEAVITPRGARVVRQASEGDRGAHLILRQIRFPVAAVDPDLVLQAMSEADRLREAVDRGVAKPEKRLA